MADLTFSQYQEIMKPFFDLIKGIVHIVGYESQEEEFFISDSLINQIMLSVTIMHLSQSRKGRDIPDKEVLEKEIKENGDEAVFNSLTNNIRQEDLTKYLSESTTIVMTNYYYEVKDRITPSKTQEIKSLYEKIEGGI
jgi:hypothetical protein